MVDFKEEIYEIAFGDNAINRGWTDEEVIAQIRWYSDTLHELEDGVRRPDYSYIHYEEKTNG